MAASLKVRNVIIGEGTPRICVPVTGASRDEILEEARVVAGLPADLAEWRADGYDDVLIPGRTEEMLRELRGILGDMPLIMTVRTAGEGGALDIDADEYAELNIRAALTGFADIVDVQTFIDGDGETALRITEAAHDAGVRVIASWHDFARTPEKKELLDRMRRMQDLGADIVKIAVMPHSMKDTVTLISAAEEMTSEYADRPVVAISMGEHGVITRIAGGFWGSSVTFAAASRPSAPGQIGASELSELLRRIQDAVSR